MRHAPRSRSWRLHGVAGGCVAVLVLALTGCTGGASATGSGVIGQPPTPGSVTQTVATPPATEPIKVGLDQEATVAGIAVRVTSVRAVDVDSSIPSDLKGPGLVFTIQLRNGSAADYRSDSLQANLVDAAGNAGSLVQGKPTTAFPATVPTGGEASADYAFVIGKEHREPVSLTVSVGAGTSDIIFTGNAPS